jgi:hypothetical protein
VACPHVLFGVYDSAQPKFAHCPSMAEFLYYEDLLDKDCKVESCLMCQLLLSGGAWVRAKNLLIRMRHFGETKTRKGRSVYFSTLKSFTAA